MTTSERLERWKELGFIDPVQHAKLAALLSKQAFSLFFELNALLYIGVLSLAAGLAWTVQTHFVRLGDTFILVSLSSMLVAAFYYCFRHSPPFSTSQVEAPNLAFDYVVYLACLLLSVELSYLELRFQWMPAAWHHYLLLSGGLFLAMAYRFDNRFVLSLALSSFAGWVGIKVSRLDDVSAEPLRASAMIYAALVATAGTFLFSRGIKKHFLETYLHVAANIGFIAVLSGLAADAGLIYMGLLLTLSATAIVFGVLGSRFAFVVYGTIFGYIGLSLQLCRHMADELAVLSYFIVSGTLVIISLVILARRFGREA